MDLKLSGEERLVVRCAGVRGSTSQHWLSLFFRAGK